MIQGKGGNKHMYADLRKLGISIKLAIQMGVRRDKGSRQDKEQNSEIIIIIKVVVVVVVVLIS